jgi:multimeric flavodoxin WrbA
MKKSILILSASPRKGGNSDLLCDQFLLGAQEAGNVIEKIFLRDKSIACCNGCEYCYNTHKCIQKDDMAEILDKMIHADIIVMATPVYFYTMNSQMKMLIDRTVPRYGEISNKEFYYIISAADSDKLEMSRTIEGFRGFTVCLDNATEKGVIYGLGAWHKGDIQGNKAMEEAYSMGRSI